jgi:hypothetical protein
MLKRGAFTGFALFSLLAAAACGPANPTATPTVAGALVQLSANPTPIVAGICAGCGDENTTEREAVTDLTIQETHGVGGTVTLIELTLKDASGAVIASGQFDSSGVIFFAGSDQLPASSSLVAANIGVHYPGSEAGKTATLTYTVHVTDDLGNQITVELAVPVTT